MDLVKRTEIEERQLDHLKFLMEYIMFTVESPQEALDTSMSLCLNLCRLLQVPHDDFVEALEKMKDVYVEYLKNQEKQEES